MLRVTLDNKLNFATRLLNIPKNSNKKFNLYFPPLLNRNLPTVR